MTYEEANRAAHDERRAAEACKSKAELRLMNIIEKIDDIYHMMRDKE